MTVDTHQLWTPTDAEARDYHSYLIRTTNGDGCLDVPDGKWLAIGNKIWMNWCNATNTNQHFWFMRWDLPEDAGYGESFRNPARGTPGGDLAYEYDEPVIQI